MSLRYSRKNQCYKVRVGTKVTPRGRKIKYQLICSAMLLICGVVLSFFDGVHRMEIRKCLYSTYSMEQWQEAIAPASVRMRHMTSKISSLCAGLFEDKSHGKPLADTPGVKADKARQSEQRKADGYSERARSPEKQTPTPEEPAPLPEEKWRMPHGGEISSPFGERIHPITGKKDMHSGTDIAASHGDTVFAVHSGIVEKTGYDNGNGNYVVLSHGDGITSVYIHLSGILVSAGENVPPDGAIGKVGSTGMSTGPHLHFEIKKNGVSVDPSKYISG